MTSHEQQQHEPHQVGVDELHEELDSTPVHAAAREGRVEDLRSILLADAAAREGRVEDLRSILLADAAQAVALDKYGLTPLHWACDRGQSAAARLLLQHGADVDAVEKRMFKRRPLHFAVLASSDATVRELLARHADVLVVDYRGWAPIHGAAYSGDVASLAALLDAGASATTQLTARRETALHVAVSRGHADAARLLLKRSPGDEGLLELEDDEGSTAAQVAARGGHESIACLLGQH